MRFIANILWTILGVLAALMCKPLACRREKNALAFLVKRIWFTERLMHFQAAGFTLGHVILIVPEYDSPELVGHELVHVRQFDRYWGIFPLVYLVANRNGWHQNVFEKEAIAQQKNVR